MSTPLMTTSPVATASSTSPATALDEPGVHRLLHDWLRVRDEARPAEEVLQHLVPEGLVVHFPQVTLRGREQFRDWYLRAKALFPQERHEVEDVQVRLTSPLHAEVSVDLRWQLWSPGRRDGWIGLGATQHWSVVLRDGAARLRTLAMDRVQLLPDSAPIDLLC